MAIISLIALIRQDARFYSFAFVMHSLRELQDMFIIPLTGAPFVTFFVFLFVFVIPAPRAVPAGMFKAMSVVMGLIEKIVPLPEAYTREGLRGIAGVTYIGDNSKARRELGYNPRPLQEGLAETLQHEMRLLGMRP